MSCDAMFHRSTFFFSRGCMHSPCSAHKYKKTLGFLLPWISPWFFAGFLLSPPPYAHLFLWKPRFLVLASLTPCFLGHVYIWNKDQIEILQYACRNEEERGDLEVLNDLAFGYCLCMPHHFNNLKIGNTTKIENKHLLKSKTIKS